MVVVNEIIDLEKQRKDNCLLLKCDLKKNGDYNGFQDTIRMKYQILKFTDDTIFLRSGKE